MNIRYTYIADDGKEFEDEEECARYEEACAMNGIKGQYKMWDSNFKPTEALDEAFLLKIDTLEAAEVLYEKAGENGIEFPLNYCSLRTGAWFYDENAGWHSSDWKDWNEITEGYNKINSILNGK